MSHWERAGKSDEWYTPKYVFDALGCIFDLDVAAPLIGREKLHVSAHCLLSKSAVPLCDVDWFGFVWMNPPFGGRNAIKPWLDKFFEHGNGIALTPDRTSAPWWQEAAAKADAILFVDGKIKFERPDGSTGNSPGNGTTLLAAGHRGVQALNRAFDKGLGLLAKPTAGVFL